jgi:hypothetical protein
VAEFWNPTSLRRITHRAAALSYFCATLIEFFTDSLDAKTLEHALAPSAVNESLGRLAGARRLIDVITCGPAWTDVSAFRDEWKMTVIDATGDSARLDTRRSNSG